MVSVALVDQVGSPAVQAVTASTNPLVELQERDQAAVGEALVVPRSTPAVAAVEALERMELRV